MKNKAGWGGWDQLAHRLECQAEECGLEMKNVLECREKSGEIWHNIGSYTYLYFGWEL